MPTLEEVARHSGVSRSTVSRVINNDPHVSEETRQKVLQAIAELDYHPNAVARSLAAGHTQIIGLVIPTAVAMLFSDPYFPRLIQGVAAACNASDYSVMLWIGEPEYERRTIHRHLNSGLLDGIIVASAVRDDPVVSALHQSGLPFVMVGRPEDPTISYVDVDNVHGAREAVLHLLRQGYRRIATITGPLNTAAALDRLEGYRMALQSRGIAVDEALIAEGDFTEEGGALAVQQLLPHRPDALFCASDTMAQGAMRTIRAAGLRIPQEMAIVGYDDMPFAPNLEPPLTTVRQPIERMGQEAVALLLDLLAHPDDGPHHLVLPTELIIRASTARS